MIRVGFRSMTKMCPLVRGWAYANVSIRKYSLEDCVKRSSFVCQLPFFDSNTCANISMCSRFCDSQTSSKPTNPCNSFRKYVNESPKLSFSLNVIVTLLLDTLLWLLQASTHKMVWRKSSWWDSLRQGTLLPAEPHASVTTRTKLHFYLFICRICFGLADPICCTHSSKCVFWWTAFCGVTMPPLRRIPHTSSQSLTVIITPFYTLRGFSDLVDSHDHPFWYCGIGVLGIFCLLCVVSVIMSHAITTVRFQWHWIGTCCHRW